MSDGEGAEGVAKLEQRIADLDRALRERLAREDGFAADRRKLLELQAALDRQIEVGDTAIAAHFDAREVAEKERDEVRAELDAVRDDLAELVSAITAPDAFPIETEETPFGDSVALVENPRITAAIKAAQAALRGAARTDVSLDLAKKRATAAEESRDLAWDTLRALLLALAVVERPKGAIEVATATLAQHGGGRP